MNGEKPTWKQADLEGLTTGRLEGFSDGVLAIAITLLVLQLGSGEGEGSLAHRLGEEWPFFLSYVISFLNIGVIWLNHHKVVSRLDVAGEGRQLRRTPPHDVERTSCALTPV